MKTSDTGTRESNSTTTPVRMTVTLRLLDDHKRMPMHRVVRFESKNTLPLG